MGSSIIYPSLSSKRIPFEIQFSLAFSYLFDVHVKHSYWLLIKKFSWPAAANYWLSLILAFKSSSSVASPVWTRSKSIKIYLRLSWFVLHDFWRIIQWYYRNFCSYICWNCWIEGNHVCKKYEPFWWLKIDWFFDLLFSFYHSHEPI